MKCAVCGGDDLDLIGYQRESSKRQPPLLEENQLLKQLLKELL